MKQEILKLNMDSVQDYNENLGVETLHPLVSVVKHVGAERNQTFPETVRILCRLSQTIGMRHDHVRTKQLRLSRRYIDVCSTWTDSRSQ